ncbi:MAG TPA: hypothetical protein VIS74_00830 [Chthoniobacterales bacterium]
MKFPLAGFRLRFASLIGMIPDGSAAAFSPNGGVNAATCAVENFPATGPGGFNLLGLS